MSFTGAAALSSIGDIASVFLSQYFNKKNMRDQAQLQYDYAQRYALNSPTWNVQGLRDAGLNPILSVSNGVNLGANIPNITNSSPKADIKVPGLEALKASKEVDIGQQNADSNSETADAQTMTANANMLRAKSDANLKQAETLKVLQETQRANHSKYSSPIVRDIMGLRDELVDQSKDIVKEASAYLFNAPQRHDSSHNLLPKATSTQVKHTEQREKEYNRFIDSQWKTSKKIDGKPIYRKRGDVGGVMHMYR